MANKPIEAGVLREFVNAVRDASAGRIKATEYLSGVVTHTDVDGTVWVDVAGGVNDMPVARTTASYSPGDVVSFSIENGVASIGGNVTDPGAPISKQITVEKRVVKTEETVEKIGNIVADKADITELNAATARIGNLEADHVSTTDLQAETARVDTLLAGKASVADLNAAKGRIDDLEADHVSTTDLQAVNGEITNLKAKDVAIEGNITAATGRIGTLETENTAVKGRLTAAEGNITTLNSTKANIADIEANYIDADTIEATYMRANMSNSDVAWIQNGVIANGAISSAMINDVSANKLTAGTINGSVINVTNLNADNITTGTINGQRIGEGSLSLDKLSEDVYTESEVDAKLSTMQQQIDGAIETWTGTAVPTLQNAPASSWTTTQLKDQHVGDVYFVVNSQSQQNGYNYRFTKTGSTYSWQLIKDSDVTNALQRLETAEGKITTFDSDISTLKTDTGTLKTKTTSLETRMSDAESDILDKVDTTTFNSLEDTVTGHTQTLSQHTTAISNKADSSTVTALTTKVNKNETDISGINTTIGTLQTTVASKADGSALTTVSNKLNTVSDTVDGHTQTISSVQSTLATKADSSTVSTLTERVSTTESNVSGITTRLTATESVANGVRTDLDNLEIGGRNLLLWSGEANHNPISRWGSQNSVTSKEYDSTTESMRYVTPSTGNVNNGMSINTLNANWVNSDNASLIANGETYTFSIDVMASLSDENPINMKVFYSTPNGDWAATGYKNVTEQVSAETFTRIYTTFTLPQTRTEGTRLALSVGALNATMYFKRPKLERGNKPTDWTPAPEDLETEVTTLKTDYATYKQTTTEALSEIGTTYATKTELGTETSNRQTAIQQLNNTISSKANASDVYTKTDVNGLISTEASNRNSAIQQSAEAITQSVSSTYATKTELSADLAALTERVTTAESSITQQAGEIALKANASDVNTKAETTALLEVKANKATLTSEINASADTVKIDATRVNIEGAAIFTSGRLSQTSLDGAYDTSGAASAAQAAAISAAATDATSKANAAEANAKAAIPTDISDLNNDAGYQTASQVSSAISTGTANLAGKADAVVRTQRIYYRTDMSSVPHTPGTNVIYWVTNGNTESSWHMYDDWSTRVPPIAVSKAANLPKRPYLYTCEQREMGDGRLAYTTVLLDDSDTIIDGGNIITGTVTANQLNAANINASNTFTVGALHEDAQVQLLNSELDNTFSYMLGEIAKAARTASDYLHYANGELTLGSGDSDIRSVLTNVKFAFKTDAGDIAYFGLNEDGIWQMHIATAFVDDMLRFGDYAWIKRENGNMSIKWLGATS